VLEKNTEKIGYKILDLFCLHVFGFIRHKWFTHYNYRANYRQVSGSVKYDFVNSDLRNNPYYLIIILINIMYNIIILLFINNVIISLCLALRVSYEKN
jgi:hypothetical protein